MRAILKLHGDFERKRLEECFRASRWTSPFAQDHESVVKECNDLLRLVAEGDRIIVENTMWMMIYNNDTRTWGLVNSPQEGALEIRLRNAQSKTLMRACDHLVTTLQKYLEAQPSKASLDWGFADVIEVLEPNSQHHAFYGEVLPQRKFRFALEQRRWEVLFGCFCLTLAIAFAFMTLPFVESVWGALLHDNGSWKAWYDGNLARLSTSFLVTSLASFFTLISHYFDLKRIGAIKWTLR